jgi:hypothetical protein
MQVSQYGVGIGAGTSLRGNDLITKKGFGLKNGIQCVWFEFSMFGTHRPTQSGG